MQIPEFNYSIDEQGNVTNLTTGLVLKPCLNKQTGYLYVSLWKANKGYTFTVHRLVAKLFIPNPENKPEVNHKNSKRDDPRKDNLEWVTHSENMIHGYEFGYMSQIHRRKIQPFELDMIIEAVIDGASQSSAAALFGISEGTLSARLSKHLKSHERQLAYKRALIYQKTKRNTAANSDKKLPVLQYDKQGNFIQQFASITEATRLVPTVYSGSLSNALNPNNPQKSAGGFLWKFA